MVIGALHDIRQQFKQRHMHLFTPHNIKKYNLHARKLSTYPMFA